MTDDSLRTVAADVRGGRRTAVSVVEQALGRVDRLDPALNAFVAVDRQRALTQAADVDAALARGESIGPLTAVPLAVKDTEDTIGYRTTYGSLIWRDAPIAERDSVLVARLRAAGCVVIGKTNTPELAASAETENLLFGATRNPLDPSRTPGGSSGGSATAVRAGMVPLATASDGGGSIRIPASACGLPGFKASLGRIPDGGPRPVDWPALTTRGVLTRTVEELLAVLDVIVGPTRPIYARCPHRLSGGRSRSVGNRCRRASRGAPVSATAGPTRASWRPAEPQSMGWRTSAWRSSRSSASSTQSRTILGRR